MRSILFRNSSAIGSKRFTFKIRTYMLYGSGQNIHAALGNGVSHEFIPFERPQQSLYFKKMNVVDAACGHSHSAIVTKNENGSFDTFLAGRGYDWVAAQRFERYGSGEPSAAKFWLALGFGYNIEFKKPFKILESANQPRVFCSAALTMLLVDNKLMSIGFNYFGQCGVSDSNFVHNLTLVQLPQDEVIKKVSLGFEHVAVLGASGNLCTFGKFNRGQLGYEQTSTHIKRIILSDVEDVVTGFASTCVLKKNGSVLITGQAQGLEYNKRGNNYQDQIEFREISFFRDNFIKIKKLYSGYYYYLAVEAGTNEVYMWGVIPDANDLGLIYRKIELFSGTTMSLPDESVPFAVSRTIRTPFKLGLFLQDEDKLFPGQLGFYLLRKDSSRLTFFDWNLIEKSMIIETQFLLPNSTLRSIHPGRKHNLLLYE